MNPGIPIHFIALAATLALLAAAYPASHAAPAGAVGFEKERYRVAETAGRVRIGVVRGTSEKTPMSVHFATGSGSALAGQDFEPTAGILTWSAGNRTTQYFEVKVRDNADPDGDRTLVLHLRNLSSATPGPVAQARLVITDDEGGVTREAGSLSSKAPLTAVPGAKLRQKQPVPQKQRQKIPELADKPAPKAETVPPPSAAPAPLTVPNVLGMSLKQARAAIDGIGLKSTPALGDPAATAAAAGTVQKTHPKAGETAAKGARVTVYVFGKPPPSRPDKSKTKVPDVTGEPFVRAQSAIREAGLVALPTLGDPAPTARRAGRVQKTEPTAGAEISPGQKVTVFVYGKPQEP